MTEPQLLAAVLALVGVIAVALLNLHINSRNAKELRKKPFLEHQLDLSVEACTVAATLATTRSAKTFEQAHERFWVLYWGPLSIVEDRAVQDAMVEFAEALPSPMQNGALPPRGSLSDLSYDLALTVRRLILDAWDIGDLGALLERKPSGEEVSSRPFVETAERSPENP